MQIDFTLNKKFALFSAALLIFFCTLKPSSSEFVTERKDEDNYNHLKLANHLTYENEFGSDGEYDFLVNEIIHSINYPLNKINFISNNRFTSNTDPQTITTVLVDIGAIPLLQEDIFKRTNRINERSLLDFPIFYMPIKYSSSESTITATPFYNTTNQVYFTRTSPFIESYLAVNSETLLQKISELEFPSIPGFDLNPIDVLPLFKNMTIEERRVGLMFRFMHQLEENAHVRIMFPLYYLETNFNLPPAEQEVLKSTFGNPQDNSFAQEFLINDKVGLGDLRVAYDFPVIDAAYFHARLGIFSTIPTAAVFKDGLYGSHFPQAPPIVTPINLTQLFCNAQGTPEQQELALKEGTDFFLNTIKRLSAIILEQPLGNGRHFGIGSYVRYKTYLRGLISREWAQDIFFNSFLSFELFTSKRHLRAYIEKSDVSEFNKLGLNRNKSEIIDELNDDEEYADTVLAFFEQQMTEKLNPFFIDTQVWPGFVFRWASKAHYEGKRWGVEAGFDTWVKAKEQLYDQDIPSAIPQDINVDIARRPISYQWKLFGNIFYKKRTDEGNWLFSLTSDYTLSQTGIGGDFTVGFVIEKHF